MESLKNMQLKLLMSILSNEVHFWLVEAFDNISSFTHTLFSWYQISFYFFFSGIPSKHKYFYNFSFISKTSKKGSFLAPLPVRESWGLTLCLDLDNWNTPMYETGVWLDNFGIKTRKIMYY